MFGVEPNDTVGQEQIEVNRTAKNRVVGIAVLNYTYLVSQPYPEYETEINEGNLRNVDRQE